MKIFASPLGRRARLRAAAPRLVYPSDDVRLGCGLLFAAQASVGERELVVRLRVAGREFGGAAQVLDGLRGATARDEGAAQRDARLVEVRVDFERPPQLLQRPGDFGAAALQEQDAESQMPLRRAG